MSLKLFTFLFALQISAVAIAQVQETEETIRSVSESLDSADKQMCRNFTSLNSGQRLQSHICEPYWPKTTAIVVTAPKNASAASGDESDADGNSDEVSATTVEVGMPAWTDQVRDRPETLDKKSSEYEGDVSPAQMAERGRTMASRAELTAMESLFARTRNSLAERCCGNSRECTNVFRRVRLQFCTNPRARTHPNEPDRCTSRDSGIFTVSDDENYMRWWLLRVSRLPEATREATRASVLSEKPHLRNKLGEVAPGIVSISRYERADNPDTIWTLRHELGHACSSVRRQIAARNGTSMRVGDEYNPDPKVYCRYSSQAYQQFSFMGDYMRPENARETGACISNSIREEFRDRNNEAYIENACYGAKIEEGLAEAFALLTAPPEDVMYNLEVSCTYAPSRMHFTGSKIVQCIAENSPRFRNTVLAAPVCRADLPPAAPEGGGTEAGFNEGNRNPFMNNTLLSTPAVSPTPIVTPAPSPAPSPSPSPAQGGSQL